MEDPGLCPHDCATYRASERGLVANCLREALDELEQALSFARRHCTRTGISFFHAAVEQLPDEGRDARPHDYRSGLETRPETGLQDERPPLPAFTGSVHDLDPRDVELSR